MYSAFKRLKDLTIESAFSGGVSSESSQGLMHVRGRPTVAYDQQGLVFGVAMGGGAVKLFDVRSYDKVGRRARRIGPTTSRLQMPFGKRVLFLFV